VVASFLCAWPDSIAHFSFSFPPVLCRCSALRCAAAVRAQFLKSSDGQREGEKGSPSGATRQAQESSSRAHSGPLEWNRPILGVAGLCVCVWH
jgi:hypothetical protein